MKALFAAALLLVSAAALAGGDKRTIGIQDQDGPRYGDPNEDGAESQVVFWCPPGAVVNSVEVVSDESGEGLSVECSSE